MLPELAEAGVVVERNKPVYEPTNRGNGSGMNFAVSVMLVAFVGTKKVIDARLEVTAPLQE